MWRKLSYFRLIGATILKHTFWFLDPTYTPASRHLPPPPRPPPHTHTHTHTNGFFFPPSALLDLHRCIPSCLVIPTHSRRQVWGMLDGDVSWSLEINSIVSENRINHPDQWHDSRTDVLSAPRKKSLFACVTPNKISEVVFRVWTRRQMKLSPTWKQKSSFQIHLTKCSI